MGAKTSIAESVESLFCFYENFESLGLIVVFLFRRNEKVILSFREKREIWYLCFVSTGRVIAPAF